MTVPEIQVSLKWYNYSLQQKVKQRQNKFPVVPTTLIDLCQKNWTYICWPAAIGQDGFFDNSFFLSTDIIKQLVHFCKHSHSPETKEICVWVQHHHHHHHHHHHRHRHRRRRPSRLTPRQSCFRLV